MSALRESLESGRFTVTGEVGPPKGIDIHEMLEDAEHLRGKVAAINVTDIQSAVMRVSCLAICIKLKEMGLEPVLQMVCRDRNRLALQSDLLGAAVMGIENVLSLTGDHTTLGDHKDAKPVFDLDSVSLLQTMTTLMSGKDLAGLELKGSPKFFPGAVVTPCSDPVEPQLYKMEKKVAAGAKFFQTQAVYSAKSFEKFMKRAEQFKVPVLVGIVLLKNAGMAKFMNDNVAGVVVPKKIVKEIGSVPAADRMKKSAEIGARLIREMKGMCQGAHIMPLGWDKIVPDVIAQAGLS